MPAVSSPIGLMVQMSCINEEVEAGKATAGAKTAGAKTVKEQREFTYDFVKGARDLQNAVMSGTKPQHMSDEDWNAAVERYRKSQLMTFDYMAMTSSGFIAPYITDQAVTVSTTG